MVDGHFAELVHDDKGIRKLRNQAVHERGLAAAEKPGDDDDRSSAVRDHTFISRM
jgi:hypothetical protein